MENKEYVWTTKQLKTKFHEYFESKGHKTLPSSSVIPENDPTLLFVNSGMVQFKNIFLGGEAQYKRVNTSQYCIRAGGKHNDLDDVGKDNYHHTFFEMLGNWSFGDYFKEEAIKYAYEFLVEVLKINKENLYVTVYDEMDKESRSIWKKYLPESKIVSSGYKDNFWEMGEFGPCGPCTEIHYDRIGGRNASELVNKDDPNVLEIWNIVFMEYNKTAKGLFPLEIKKIDTGIGLERLLSILNGVKSNYLIDTFYDIIRFTENRCKYRYNDEENTNITVAFRVVSDHARTLAVCLFYNVPISNEGVGYVLRRILRRAVRFSSEILGIEQNCFSEIVQEAARVLDLGVIDVTAIDIEENQFKKSLNKGLAQLHKIIENNGEISSENVFLLYDTFGFPKDLTEMIAKEKEVKIDLSNFDSLLEEQKERSKKGRNVPITLDFPFDKTDDSYKYLTGDIHASLKAIVLGNEIVTNLEPEKLAALIFDKTNFYGECGGQIGDSGKINFYKNDKIVGYFDVVDTQLVRGYVIHYGELSGEITENALLKIDQNRRILIRNNHSSCHILGSILQKYISADISQQGSFVDDKKCTYDFNIKEKLSADQIDFVERKMNQFISSNATVSVLNMSKEEVERDNSIILMKNVIYPEPIRVIQMQNEEENFKELCGGTHVEKAGQIGKIKIVGENGKSVGIRRITLVSGEIAEECERNSKTAREAIKKGIIANMDCLYSVIERREIDGLNRELVRKKNKEIQKRQKEYEEDFKELVLSRKVAGFNLKGENRNLLEKNLEFPEIDKKNQQKVLATLGMIFSKDKIDSLIYMQQNDEINLLLFLNEGEQTYKEIIKKYGETLRISRNSLQGILNKELFNDFRKLIKKIN
ncbi:hypothetical protein NUSPORA_01764 [Nucleospora cyclopteri]